MGASDFQIITPALVKRMFKERFTDVHARYDELMAKIEAMKDEPEPFDAVQSLAYDPSRYPHYIELEASNG